ncbi:hypothetical protein GOP47_0013263 [Adiantum capillus-veneris]|uniref:Uncharacterized protein n=1 Tax=Adiantum capillus-veneris TaxID=13818 RepID=A0A9D4UNQ5_ADICA|nr:hypothetical protein GOP47_0013263 [Adiantum capillus-veneris]
MIGFVSLTHKGAALVRRALDWRSELQNCQSTVFPPLPNWGLIRFPHWKNGLPSVRLKVLLCARLKMELRMRAGGSPHQQGAINYKRFSQRKQLGSSRKQLIINGSPLPSSTLSPISASFSQIFKVIL